MRSQMWGLNIWRKGMLEVWWVKLQNRMHQGCIKGETDGIAGTLFYACGSTGTDTQKQIHTETLCAARQASVTCVPPLSCLSGAAKLEGICWGGPIVFSLNWTCFRCGSLSLAWILCKRTWMEAFITCEVAVVSAATLPATCPVPQL